MKIKMWTAVAASALAALNTHAAAKGSFDFAYLTEGSGSGDVSGAIAVPIVAVIPASVFASIAKKSTVGKTASQASEPAIGTTGATPPATFTSGATQPANVTTTATQPANTTSGASLMKAFGTDAPDAMFARDEGVKKLAPIINVKQELLTTRAIPTNKWWGNLIHSSDKDTGVRSYLAWANPYTLKLPVGTEGVFGLQACYSYAYRTKAGLKDEKIKYYAHDFHNDVTLSAAEFTAVPTYEVYDWTDMGISLSICSGGKCMDSALINGMAFVSAEYKGLTPHIVSEATVSKLEQANGKYVIELSNKQKWVMYASPAATFTADGKIVKASGPYTGTIRLAILPEAAAADIYDAYAGCVVRGGRVSVESRTQYTLNWQAEGATCASKGLLHFAFQHHLDSFGEGSAVQAPATPISLYSTVRGAMTGRVALASSGNAAWKLTEPELKDTIGFYPPRKIDPAVVEKLQLKKKLEDDISKEWKIDGVSYYFSGKAYQKYASLCLMADDPLVAGEDKTLLSTCTKKLQGLLEKFLSNKFPFPLIYDTTYRGIATLEAIQTNQVYADFGNTIYNDHHYHYGYWIAASAMLRKLDPNWSRIADLDKIIWTMLRDVANPSAEDEHFPTFRHFSWFLGHSISHGATPMENGKDQESTSEDINFFYGMMLWGQVVGNKAVEDLGSLMLRIDARAVRTYFLMTSDNKIHPPEFVKNHVTGIFFDNKADYTTWFKDDPMCIHGIQMIPLSPVNEIVRSATFVKEEWDDVLSKQPAVSGKDMTNPWNSLLYANYAAVNKEAALEVLENVAMDDGLTRSWALYIAANRP